MLTQEYTEEARKYWEGLERSELWIQRCRDCGEYNFFPREYCPKDMGELLYEKVTGKGKVLTYSIVVNHGEPGFKDLVPYVAAIVELDEGPKMYTRIETANIKDVSFNQKVEVIFREYEGKRIPLFRPTLC